MSRFYFFVWLYWVVRVVACGVVSGAILAALVTAVLYINKGLPPLTDEVWQALWQIFLFWLTILLNLSILFALFRSAKYLFNRCHAGYKFVMMACQKEQKIIEAVGYGDIVKFWRKWLLMLVWIVASMTLFSWVVSLAFIKFGSFFEYFSVWWLYGFILLAGYPSFVLIGSRCKQMRIKRC